MAVCVSISSEPEAWIIVSLTWQWHYSRLAIPNRSKTVMPTIRASVLPWIATLAFLFTGSQLIKTQTYCWNCTFCFVFFCLLRYLRLFIILFWSGRWNIFGVFVVYYAKAFTGSAQLRWKWISWAKMSLTNLVFGNLHFCIQNSLKNLSFWESG